MTATYYTVKQAAAVLNCSTKTILTMIRDKRIKALNLNKGGKQPTYRIRPESVAGLSQ